MNFAYGQENIYCMHRYTNTGLTGRVLEMSHYASFTE